MPLPLWHAAVALAERGHAGQLRKDGRTPYAAHVVRVMMIVRDVFGCDDQAALAAAVLHDFIEDTPGDFDDIEGVAGPDAARLVAQLTKNAALPEAEREAAYEQQIAEADPRAKLIKLADTLDNLSDLGTLDPADTARRARAIDRAERLLAVIADSADGGTMAPAIGRVRAVLDQL